MFDSVVNVKIHHYGPKYLTEHFKDVFTPYYSPANCAQRSARIYRCHLQGKTEKQTLCLMGTLVAARHRTLQRGGDTEDHNMVPNHRT